MRGRGFFVESLGSKDGSDFWGNFRISLGAVGCADVAGTGLGLDGGARVHGISGGGVYLAGSSGVDGLFGGAAEVICGDPHHTHAGRVADFDRGAGEEPAPGVQTSRFSEHESRRTKTTTVWKTVGLPSAALRQLEIDHRHAPVPLPVRPCNRPLKTIQPVFY